MKKTFDNPALNGDLLTRTVGELKKLGFKTTGIKKDKKGLYAFVMQAPSGFPFALVCKGSALYRNDILSIQLELPSIWHGPIIIGWMVPEATKPQFYVFDPVLILAEKKFLNDRFETTMINFSITLGRLWNPETESIESVWAKARSKQQPLMVT